MLSNLKSIIRQLAKNAVVVAETELNQASGQQKKQKAIEYIISNLPFSSLVKSIISIFLSGFIDNSVEAAVLYMQSLRNKKENE